jgi:hypothetical protein
MRRLIPYAGAEPQPHEAPRKPAVPIYSPLEVLILHELGAVSREVAILQGKRDKILRRLDAVRRGQASTKAG